MEMDINIIFWYFILLALGVNVLGYAVNYGNVPDIIKRLFLYGKASAEQLTGILTVPKSWFLHFYLVGALEMTLAMACVIRVNIVGDPAPSWLHRVLAILAGHPRQSSCSPEALVLASCLLTAQIYRRLYEHLFVHISSETRIHVGHYLAGLLHYVLGVAALLAEAPGFVADASSRRLFNVTKLGWLERACGGVFMLAWLHQYRAHCILADLRRDETGAVVSRKHAVPRGDWFQYVSCPHYLTEVVMYTCLSLILGLGHVTWLSVWLWVVSNQTASAIMSHIWYKRKFEDYPKERRAIFPGLL